MGLCTGVTVEPRCTLRLIPQARLLLMVGVSEAPRASFLTDQTLAAITVALLARLQLIQDMADIQVSSSFAYPMLSLSPHQQVHPQ